MLRFVRFYLPFAQKLSVSIKLEGALHAGHRYVSEFSPQLGRDLPGGGSWRFMQAVIVSPALLWSNGRSGLEMHVLCVRRSGRCFWVIARSGACMGACSRHSPTAGCTTPAGMTTKKLFRIVPIAACGLSYMQLVTSAVPAGYSTENGGKRKWKARVPARENAH